LKRARGGKAILRLSDIENGASDSGEEFVGFNTVSATSDKDSCDEDTEDSLEEVCPDSSSFVPTMINDLILSRT